MKGADAQRLPELLAIADAGFDPSISGSGAAAEHGFGPNYRHHMALENLVRGLGRFPGQGWRHVRTILRSPSIRGRITALRTLEEWGEEAWPTEARTVLETAAAAEPVEDVRDRYARLLAGEPVDLEDDL